MITLNAGTISDEGIDYSFIQNPLKNTAELKYTFQLYCIFEDNVL